MDDNTQVRRFGGGDKNVFIELVLRHRDLVRGMVLGSLGLIHQLIYIDIDEFCCHIIFDNRVFFRYCLSFTPSISNKLPDDNALL